MLYPLEDVKKKEREALKNIPPRSPKEELAGCTTCYSPERRKEELAGGTTCYTPEETYRRSGRL
jgi:hypothetical protein